MSVPDPAGTTFRWVVVIDPGSLREDLLGVPSKEFTCTIYPYKQYRRKRHVPQLLYLLLTTPPSIRLVVRRNLRYTVSTVSVLYLGQPFRDTRLVLVNET